VETSTHRTLKQLAAAYLRRHGCQAIATEVRCPSSAYRVDVAGYRDTTGVPRERRPPPTTVIVECKGARGDFLRDCGQRDALLAHRRELERLRRHIEERRIRVHEPHLRVSGSSLFAELEEWDFSGIRMRGDRRILRTIARIERKLYGQTKFFTIARYRLADRLYLAAPRGMIKRGEIPPGWGLLEQCADGLRVEVEAPVQGCSPERRQRLLRNIAVAASRTVLASEAVRCRA
jgi:hypothetical protein